MALIAADIKPRAEEMAQRLIAWASLTPPMDVEGAARRLGIDIEELHLSGAVSGMLVWEAPKRWVIIVNSRYRDPRRRRFTIAHEIGHWTLHRPQLHLLGSSLKLLGQWEREANEFASHLLLPPDLLQRHMSMFGQMDLEKVFGVSTSAALTGLRRLGYQVWV